MYKRLILLVFVAFSALWEVKAQGKLSLSQVDAKTYELFIQNDWEGLIREGTNAIDQGIDYYYLRVRLGIAYFKQGNYHQAAKYFEGALDVNKEEYVQEYLYYSYLWSGRESQAKLMALGFSPQMKIKTKTDQSKVLKGLELANNYTAITDQKVIDEFTADVDPLAEGYQFIPRFHHYGFLGLDLDINSRFNLYQGFSVLQATQFYYNQDGDVPIQNTSYVSDSWQYYAGASFYLGQGVHLSAGGHYLNISYLQQQVVGVGNGQQTQLVSSTQKDSDFLVFGSISKNFMNLDLGATVYYGTINNGKQIQSDLNLTLFPLGNLNFYTFSVFTFQSQEFTNTPSVNRFIFNQEIGAKVTGFLWLEGYGTFGEIENYFTKQGLVVFNRLDKIESRLGMRAIVLPHPNWKLTLDFSHFSNSSSFQTPSEQTQEQNLKSYQLQSLTAILSWKF